MPLKESLETQAGVAAAMAHGPQKFLASKHHSRNQMDPQSRSNTPSQRSNQSRHRRDSDTSSNAESYTSTGPTEVQKVKAMSLKLNPMSRLGLAAPDAGLGDSVPQISPFMKSRSALNARSIQVSIHGKSPNGKIR
jgi:hypothetical protein